MNAKKKEKAEKFYSYDEYKRTFFPDSATDLNSYLSDPVAFGIKLAEEAIKETKDETT